MAGRGLAILGWALRIALAALFGYAGTQKLMADPHMVEVFAKVGIGQWFRLVTGSLEIAGAIGLLVPRLAVPAAAGLAGVMVGATVAHLTRLDSSPTLAVALLVACCAVVVIERRRVRA